MPDTRRNPDGETLEDLPDDSRPRGFLTETDRRYLRGESDVEPLSESDRKARARIRERVYHALLDFTLVFERMEDRDIQQVFDPPSEEANAFAMALNDALSVLYLGMLDRVERFGIHLNAAINNAVNRRSGDRHLTANVEFDVSVSDPVNVDVDDVIDKLANHKEHELSEAELRTFLRWYSFTRQFDPEGAREQIRESQNELGKTHTERGE